MVLPQSAVEERNATAVRFLMGPDRFQRLLSELEDLREHRLRINDEYRAAIEQKTRPAPKNWPGS